MREPLFPTSVVHRSVPSFSCLQLEGVLQAHGLAALRSAKLSASHITSLRRAEATGSRIARKTVSHLQEGERVTWGPHAAVVRASPRTVDQGHDQTEAPSTSKAIMAAVHIGTCRFINRNTPTGMENVATTVTASDSFLRTKNISDPHALIPSEQLCADPFHLATGNKQKVPPLRQPSDALRPLSRKRPERSSDPSGLALLSSQRCTPNCPVCQLW